MAVQHAPLAIMILFHSDTFVDFDKRIFFLNIRDIVTHKDFLSTLFEEYRESTNVEDIDGALRYALHRCKVSVAGLLKTKLEFCAGPTEVIENEVIENEVIEDAGVADVGVNDKDLKHITMKIEYLTKYCLNINMDDLRKRVSALSISERYKRRLLKFIDTNKLYKLPKYLIE